jgi:hypothetical protein
MSDCEKAECQAQKPVVQNQYDLKLILDNLQKDKDMKEKVLQITQEDLVVINKLLEKISEIL